MSHKTHQPASLLKYSGHLHCLSKASPITCKAILKCADAGLIRCLCECVLNILKGNVAISPSQKQKLSQHKKSLRKLIDKREGLKKKKKILQKGGFLGALIPAIAPIITNLLGGLFGGAR